MKTAQVIKLFLTANPSYSSLKDFISLCQKMILVYLYRKEKYPGYYQDVYGLDCKDLSFDVLADSFCKNKEGYYFEFTNYFFKLENYEKLTGEELLIHLRRLLFSKTNHRLFRLNKEFDPILAKIIRNVKNTIKETPSVEIILFQEQNCLVPKGYTPYEDCNPIRPLELLEMEWFPVTFSTVGLKATLVDLALLLENWNGYKKLVYLIDVAVILKSTLKELSKNDSFDSENNLLFEDIKHLINTVIEEQRNTILQSYLRKGKVNAEITHCYSNAVSEILLDVYFYSNSNGDSYFHYLQKHIPELTEKDYLENHRTKIEYLTKSAKTKLNELVTKEIFSL